MAELKRKVTIRRKEAPVVDKKSKWWLWLLLASVIIIGVILIVKYNSSNSTDKNLIAKTEQAKVVANEIIADVQSGNVDFEEAKSKVAEAQKAVDETKANAKTDDEKQAVAEAQTKVDEATKAVEASKQAAQTSEIDKTSSPEQGEGVAATTPVETSKPDNATNQNSVATTQGNQPSTNKPSPNVSSPSSATVTEGTLEQKAKDVIKGIYGNGADRKRALGSEYDAIQSKVNEMYRNGKIN